MTSYACYLVIMRTGKWSPEASSGKKCLSCMDGSTELISCTLQVDDFDLTVDSPSAAAAASPELAPQPAAETAALAGEACAASRTISDSATAGEGMPEAASARTAQWLQCIPSPGTQLDMGASGPKADHSSATESAVAEAAHAGVHDSSRQKAPAADESRTVACSGANTAAEKSLAAVRAEIESRRLTLTAPAEEEPCDGEFSPILHIPRVQPLFPLLGRAPTFCNGCR